MADYDAIVIGAGHNGLVAANVLAKGGAKVLVLERANFLRGHGRDPRALRRVQAQRGCVGGTDLATGDDRSPGADQVGLRTDGPVASPCTFGAPEDTPFVM